MVQQATGQIGNFMNNGTFFMVPTELANELDDWLKSKGFTMHKSTNNLEGYMLHVAVKSADMVTIPRFVKRS